MQNCKVITLQLQIKKKEKKSTRIVLSYPFPFHCYSLETSSFNFQISNTTLVFASVQFSSVQSLSLVWLFETPWAAACKPSLSITDSQSLLKLMSVELVMSSNHLILCRPLLLLPSIFLSIRIFSNESLLCIRWPKYWSFSFSTSPSNEYSGLISFLLSKGLSRVFFNTKVQKHPSVGGSSEASIRRCSALFTVQLSHPYMTTGKVIALTSFVGNVSVFLICCLGWS